MAPSSQRPHTGRPLTVRQRAVLEWIRRFIRFHRYPPTVREIGAAFGIRSTNGVDGHLRALERQGAIVREPWEHRGIRLVVEADSANEPTNATIERNDNT